MEREQTTTTFTEQDVRDAYAAGYGAAMLQRERIVAEEHARLRELFDEIPTDQEIDGFPYERSAGEAMRDVLALLGASHDRR